MTPAKPAGFANDRSSGRLPVAPSLAPALETLRVPLERSPVDRRVLFLCALGIGLGLAAAVLARELTALIGLITNLAFYGRWSASFVGPAGNHLGGFVVVVPVAGGLVVGLMARYGSAAIRPDIAAFPSSTATIASSASSPGARSSTREPRGPCAIW
jgi:hypothetical protein